MNEIIRYLLRRKIRTALTMFAVAVGIFAITTVGSITEQMESLVQMAGKDALSRITVQSNGYTSISEDAVRQMRRIPGVSGVTVSLVALMEMPEENTARISVNPETFMATQSDLPGLEFEPPAPGIKLFAGRLPEPQSRTEAVVSWEMAQGKNLQVGQLLEIRERLFKIVGIWEAEPTAGGRIAYITYNAAEDLLGKDPIQSGGAFVVSVIPQPGVDLEALAKRIETEVVDVRADSPQELVDQARQQVLIISLIVGASGILSLLIGTFTIVNTMAVSVHERRREIGLKKALGAEDAHILSEVVTEAVLIAGLGGLIGMLAGAGVGILGNQLLIKQMGSRLFMLTPRLAVGVIAFSVIMGVIAGAYPALQAARLDPVVALRGGGSAAYAAKGIKRFLYLIKRNLRPILTAGGIAIGIFALVTLGSLAEGLNGFLDNITVGTQNIIFLMPERAGVPMGESTTRILRRLPGVIEVLRVNQNKVAVHFGAEEDPTDVSFWGNDSPNGTFSLDLPMSVRLSAGRLYTPGSDNELIAGASLASTHHLKIGDRVRVGEKEREFIVVGIWEYIPSDLGGYNLSVYTTMEGLANAQNSAEANGALSVRVAPGISIEAMRETIKKELPGMGTQTVAEVYGSLRQVFATLIAVMGGIFSIAVFVGAVSVVNTMVIAVRERTWEIGLKKAVGAEDGDILAEVLLDAARLGALGGVLGVAVAWGVVAILNAVLQSAEGFSILALTPRLALGAVIFSALLGISAGFFPARGAAELDPAVALHAE